MQTCRDMNEPRNNLVSSELRPYLASDESPDLVCQQTAIDIGQHLSVWAACLTAYRCWFCVCSVHCRPAAGVIIACGNVGPLNRQCAFVLCCTCSSILNASCAVLFVSCMGIGSRWSECSNAVHDFDSDVNMYGLKL